MAQVVQRNRQGYEWVSFVNPTPIQTIPSVCQRFLVFMHAVCLHEIDWRPAILHWS